MCHGGIVGSVLDVKTFFRVQSPVAEAGLFVPTSTVLELAGPNNHGYQTIFTTSGNYLARTGDNKGNYPPQRTMKWISKWEDLTLHTPMLVSAMVLH